MSPFPASVSITRFLQKSGIWWLRSTGPTRLVLIIYHLPVWLPTKLYCGPAVPTCGHTESRRAGSHAPNRGSKGGLVFRSSLSVHVVMAGSTLLCESLDSSTSYSGSRGKVISHFWNSFLFCQIETRGCIYVYTVCVYFPRRQWFVLTQRLKWLLKYNIKWEQTACARFSCITFKNLRSEISPELRVADQRPWSGILRKGKILIFNWHLICFL